MSPTNEDFLQDDLTLTNRLLFMVLSYIEVKVYPLIYLSRVFLTCL